MSGSMITLLHVVAPAYGYRMVKCKRRGCPYSFYRHLRSRRQLCGGHSPKH
jgi:hypothetical protein